MKSADLGNHQAEYSSVVEVLGLGMFATLIAGSAWLFRTAAAQQSHVDAGPRR